MRALIMAGGTGGHIFPALAVAKKLQADGWQTEWLGGERGLEKQLVPQAGILLHCLQVRGMRGGGIGGKLAAPFMLMRAVWQAIGIVRQFKPHVVLGFGGYASGPGGLAAFLCNKPLLVHEQNAVAGMTNRYLAKLSRVALQAFPGVLPQAETVGNPVRDDIASLPAPDERFANRQGPLRIQVLGGSQGARSLNEKLPACLAEAFKDEAVSIAHQCGRGNADNTRDAYQQVNLNAQIDEFVEDMSGAYEQADLVICRAGALTVCEIAAAGVAALFIPFPSAVDDHQTHNAAFLVEAGAAKLIQEKDLNPGTLNRLLADMTHRHVLQAMATRARQQGVRDSAERIAAMSKEVAHD